MSRWRPPSTPASKYITPQGYRAMNEELQHLWKVKRPEVTRSVQEAAAQGDRSENAEYIYGKKMLREIDSRIRFLSKRLDDMNVVDRPPADQSRVFFGAWVTLEDEDGVQSTFRLVGPDETDGKLGYISIDSPLARALLKKQVDDEAEVDTPSGAKLWYISGIRYQQD
ncbi:transcription elongation factor GreB [Alcanivorax sp. 1008]|uniref:transcription elongation factor GreB n=1 Tax=Alcanivorax sp. 1008 TaxID=2816853 RepID=UPI001DE3FD5C|nr:transcription elongation factor GreB [Alcanivorax sp. 1008]MCC1495868.1 transcription elongation factor GreB [Alcanivorax sp. 1008]